MRNTFFTADTHFNHANIIQYCRRPYSSITEMNEVWNKSHYDSWHLFGHSHGRLPALGKSLDVGVDGHDFAPWSWGEIKTYMAGRPHNENFLG